MADEQPDPTRIPSKKQYLFGAVAFFAVAGTLVGAYWLGRTMNMLDDVKPGDIAPIPMRSSLYDLVDAPEDAEWCVFAQGAQVTAIEVSEQNVLATYRATGTDERECPNDTKFVISKIEFAGLADRYERLKSSQADRQELIRRAEER